MATMVYANRVPIDIMSISCCRSKMVAIIPAKTTQLYLFYLVINTVFSLYASVVTEEQFPVPTQLKYVYKVYFYQRDGNTVF